jgi:hypothetical protein
VKGSVTHVSGSGSACGCLGMCATPPKCANSTSGVESLHWDLLHVHVTLVKSPYPLLNSPKPSVNWGQGKNMFLTCSPVSLKNRDLIKLPLFPYFSSKFHFLVIIITFLPRKKGNRGLHGTLDWKTTINMASDNV